MDESTKDNFITILFVLVNVLISYTITYLLGCSNYIILPLSTFIFDRITIEMAIFLFITVAEKIISEYYIYKCW